MADSNSLTKTEVNKYQWKMAAFAKGIDAGEAIKEIERIETVFGSLTADNVLKASEDETALLHGLFQWDDSKAAHQFRLQQARNILNNIEIRIVSDGQPRTLPVFEVVNLGDGRVYKSIQTMDSKDIEYVKQSVRREISNMKVKLASYNSFESTVRHLDSALETL